MKIIKLILIILICSESKPAHSQEQELSTTPIYKSNIASNTNTQSFTHRASSVFIDTTLICVDSVWYSSSNPNSINVDVFNGTGYNLNYPSVQIISPSGDTIGNPLNTVYYFAHLDGIELIYTDSISVTGINDFSNYKFLIRQNFGDSTAQIPFCNTTAIREIEYVSLLLFPNPSGEEIHFKGPESKQDYVVKIFDSTGRNVLSKFASIESSLNISALKPGWYSVELTSGKKVYHNSFIKK